MNFLRFKNNNIQFTARLVEQGEGYGRNFELIHEDSEPMIEFYDSQRMSLIAGMILPIGLTFNILGFVLKPKALKN